jgi:hypothetical protein
MCLVSRTICTSIVSSSCTFALLLCQIRVIRAVVSSLAFTLVAGADFEAREAATLSASWLGYSHSARDGGRAYGARVVTVAAGRGSSRKHASNMSLGPRPRQARDSHA